jgi:hypothetical protein
MPNRCDNCINVFNPQIPYLYQGKVQYLSQLDSDGDGAGDACDWDKWTPSTNDPATNINMEAEIVAYYPNLDHAPPLVTTQAGAVTYKQAFRDGRDEPVPAPRFTIGWGWLPPALAQVHGTGDPLNPNCLPPLQCSIELVNRIQHQPAVPEVQPGVPITFTHPATGRYGKVGTFYCPCGGAGLGNTWTDRLNCRDPLEANCMPTEDELNVNPSRWKRAHLAPVPSAPYEEQLSPPPDWSWPPSTADRNFPFVNGTTPAESYWDFTYLGSGCADPANPGDLACIEGYTGAIGVLWSNLREMPGLVHSEFTGQFAGEPVDVELQQQRGGYFWSGTAGYRVTIDSTETKWTQWKPSGIEDPCWVDGCPNKIFDPSTVMVIDPSTVFAKIPAHLPPTTHPAELMTGAIAGANGSLRLRSDSAFGGAATILAEAWLDADRLYVPASEPSARIAQASAQPVQLRALVLKKSTAQPIQIVTQIGSSGAIVGLSLRTPEPELPPTLPPDIRPLSVPEFDAKHPKHAWICPKLAKLGSGAGSTTDLVRDAEGLALSALRNELLVFGGFTAGAPAPTARVLSLTGSWEEIALEPGERPGDVLAAAYHSADDAYYEVDRAGSATLLRRFSPAARTFATLARLPAPWNAMDRHWLVSGLDGDLYFVGARDKLSILARFVPGADGALAFAGTRVYPHAIITRPLAGYGRLVVVRAPDQKELSGKGKPGQSYRGGPVRETLLVSEFHPSPPAWAPALVGG